MGRAIRAVLIVLFGGLVLYQFEQQVLFPAPRVSREWLRAAAQQQGATELSLTAADGTHLYGWHIPSAGKRAVVWFDGNGATVGQRAAEFAWLQGLGMDIIHVNYRGYPQSEGSPSEAGLLIDARAAWDYARSIAPQVWLYGKSLGGGVAIGLAAEVAAEALVVESTFTSVLRTAKDIFPFLPVQFLLRNRFDSLARAPRVSCPAVVLHGEADELISVEQGRALSAALPNLKRWVAFPGEDHNAALLLKPAGRAAIESLFLDQP